MNVFNLDKIFEQNISFTDRFWIFQELIDKGKLLFSILNLF
jgi:hypothetical protein